MTLAAAVADSRASTLAIVFVALCGLCIGGVISFAQRKRWLGVVITSILVVFFAVLAFDYFRTAKG